MTLTCFVIDGRIPIDNGEPERNIRWIAKGRDNWNLSGSTEAAARLALVASLCATCRQLKLDPWCYFRAVLFAIADGTKLEDDAALWTPCAWAQRPVTQRFERRNRVPPPPSPTELLGAACAPNPADITRPLGGLFVSWIPQEHH